MIKYYDLDFVHANLFDELSCEADKVIRSNNYVFNTELFEEEFAAWNNSNYCVAVSSGTSALHLALLALGIKQGDEVITVSHTFRATAAAIKYCNAKPVFVDIDEKTFLLDPANLESKITEHTKVIIPVHLYGNVCDMYAIKNIANKYNLHVVEDCSQAHGSRINDVKVGNFGTIGTFSFYPGKGLGALSDAGCIVTNDFNLAEQIKELRSWDNKSIGYNYRMANLQAEFLRIKLKNYNDILLEKLEVANRYNKYFNFIHTTIDAYHSYHVYPILVNDRSRLIKNINSLVETKIHYPIPVHQFSQYNTNEFLPITDRISSTELSLPMYPTVNADLVSEIILENL